MHNGQTHGGFGAMRANLHYVVAAGALVGLLPALRRAHFPPVWDWRGLLASFLMLSLQAIMVAALLYTVQAPREVFRGLAERYWNSKPKLLMLIAFAAILIVAAGVRFGTMALIDCVAIMELREVLRRRGDRVAQYALAPLPAGAYLFAALVLAFSYTNVITRFRFYAAYDAVFNRLDQLLFRTTVPQLAHWAAAHFPSGSFAVLDWIYYGMFAQIGAALVICAVASGAKRALQFVGSIVVAYSLAVALFYLFPSHGPYYLDQQFASAGAALPSFSTQANLLANARYLWAQRPVNAVPMGYYIAFPCMHIAQPLLVLWFLRQWKRMVAVLAAYDVLLSAAIVLLQWHYLADLLGGVAVAVMAAWAVAGRKPERVPVSRSERVQSAAA